jgi:hypothetical protein
MRRALVSTLLVIVLGVSGIKLSAVSAPVPTGVAAGIEWCFASLCGFAGFFGQFQGEVNSRLVDGSYSAKVFHEPLKPIGETAEVFGGDFTITAGRRIFHGNIDGGTIENLNDVQYRVTIALQYDNGGQGCFTGILDHGPLLAYPPFVPTITGVVTDQPCPI